jgi:predicted RNA-binding protein YlqC (UPF0109 family)
MTIEDLREYISFLIKPILQFPDEFKIEVKEDYMGVLYTISMNQEDFGRVIGKKGVTIGMIRAIVRIVGITNGIRPAILLPDENSRLVTK